MTQTIEVFHQGSDRLGECPLWHPAEQRLYWIDSRAPAIHRADLATGTHESRPLDAVIGSFAFCRSGGLLLATATGFHRFDFEAGQASPLVDPEANLPDNRFNDGRCDRVGRFWAGTMNDVRRDPTGSLYRLDADASIHLIRGDIIVPNSIAWSPDDRTMYLADTYRTVIHAYDFDLADGAVSNGRIFADTAGRKGRPDGSAIDEAGCLWNAEYAGGSIVRYAPDGRIDQVVDMPVSQPSCCCFGGPDLGTLFVTSATQRLSPEDLAAQPLAGAVFAINVGVKGLPESFYAG
jgi:sugar lactone lactonase YvrE